jgi:hypothetical protein
MAEMFTKEELEQIQDRANELANVNETDASLRTALQLFAESAGNLIPKIGAVERDI